MNKRLKIKIVKILFFDFAKFFSTEVVYMTVVGLRMSKILPLACQ